MHHFQTPLPIKVYEIKIIFTKIRYSKNVMFLILKNLLIEKNLKTID